MSKGSLNDLKFRSSEQRLCCLRLFQWKPCWSIIYLLRRSQLSCSSGTICNVETPIVMGLQEPVLLIGKNKYSEMDCLISLGDFITDVTDGSLTGTASTTVTQLISLDKMLAAYFRNYLVSPFMALHFSNSEAAQDAHFFGSSKLWIRFSHKFSEWFKRLITFTQL